MDTTNITQPDMELDNDDNHSDEDVFEDTDYESTDIETSSVNSLENLIDNLEMQPSVNCINAEVSVTETGMTTNINQNPCKIKYMLNTHLRE